jgi:hypothetical protein
MLEAVEKKQSLKKWSQGLKNGTAAGPNFFRFFPFGYAAVVQLIFLPKII